jgi:hypothetical protein
MESPLFLDVDLVVTIDHDFAHRITFQERDDRGE